MIVGALFRPDVQISVLVCEPGTWVMVGYHDLVILTLWGINQIS